ncbi:hypothetical protein BZZ01_18850 [Nostocales cyanobacterium HT-58-2]|nr:hypothetical protein BZZ01_18850 [Nostocales cyanobacterium HT-58-2]
MRFLQLFALLLVLPMAMTPQATIAQSIDQLFQQGTAAHRAGDYQKAESKWRLIIQREPKNVEAHYRLGRALRDQGRFDEAIAEFREAIKLKPSHSYAYNGLGTVFDEQKKFNEAITAYRKAIELDSRNTHAYRNLGMSLEILGKLDEAIAAYRKAIQFAPNDADASYSYNLLSRAYYLQKNFDQALATYRKALQRDPQDPFSYNGLGVTLLSLGRVAEAITEFERAIQLDPNNYTNAQNNLREANLTLARLNPQYEVVYSQPRSPSTGVSDKALKSTALILTKFADGNNGRGTGWVIEREGSTVWIVTNRHVVGDEKRKQLSKQISVEFYSGDLPDVKRPRYSATIEKITDFDEEPDLAVLKVTGVPSDIQKFTYHLGKVQPGTDVHVIGHPINFDSPWRTVRGTMTGYNQQGKMDIAATLAKGNSGSPVINEQEEVVGMVVETLNNRDLAPDPNEPTPMSGSNLNATSGYGKAYRIDPVIEKLRRWNLLK